MKKQKISLAKRLLSSLVGIAMMATMITVLMPLPVANAAAATSVVAAATFNSAGLAACQDNILVTFTEPVCGNADCTEGLSVSNFVYNDLAAGGTDQTISSVTHAAGNNWALVIMNAALDAGDTASVISIEEVYTPSGMVKEDSALTTFLTADTTAPTVSVKRLKEGANDLLLQFSEPVQDQQCTNASLANTDFTYADTDVDTLVSISTATSTVHRDWVYLTGNANYAAATDSTETLAPADNLVYDMVGNEWVEAAAALSTFTADSTVPAISSAYGKIGENATGGNDLVFVNFSEPVFAANTNSGNLVAADFAHSTATVSTFTHTAGDTFGVMDLNANQTAMGTVDTETAVGGDDDVFDVFGNALLSATAAVTITDNTFPVIRGVWVNQFIEHGSTTAAALGGGTVANPRVTAEATLAYPTEGATMISWTDATVVDGTDGFMSHDLNVDLYDTANDLFEFTQVEFDLYYEDAGAAGLTGTDDLLFVLNDAADFTTASEWAITAVAEKTWTTVTIDLTGTATGTTLAAQGTTAAANPQFFGIKTTATTSSFDDTDFLYMDNIRFSRGASSKSNQVILEYSEAVDLTGDPAVGASGASTTTSANMTTSKTLAGMGAFATGTLTTKTLTNTLAKSADGTIYTTTLANGSGGLITTASPVTLSGLFTPTANVTDIATNAIAVGSTHTPETVIDALDLTTAATAVTDFRVTLVTGGQIRLGWTSPSQTAATFSHYVIPYATATGASVASATLWDEVNQVALATAVTNEATVTGLTDGTVYYFNIAGVDKKGIATSLVTEKSALPSAASGSRAETTAPAIPTGLATTINDSGKVVLTWTDPTDSDLSYVQLAKSIGTDVVPASILARVNAGAKTYTDTDVNIGDVANYKINAVDKNGNSSAFSSVVSLTVKIGVEEEEAVVEEEAPAEEEIVGEEEVGEEEAPEEEEELGELEITTESGATITLTDVSSHWAETKIEAMTEKEIVKGNPDGSFKPNSSLNRAEGSALLYRVLGLSEPSAPLVAPFSDVAKTSWYAGYVNKLKTLAIVNGNPDGTYKPANNINRAEFLTLALRTYYYMTDEATQAEIDALKAGAKTTKYKDLKDTWYTTTVTAATGLGFVQGSSCTGGTCFNAESNITRAEATTILYNMFFDLL